MYSRKLRNLKVAATRSLNLLVIELGLYYKNKLLCQEGCNVKSVFMHEGEWLRDKVNGGEK